jgi:hypothetical protein
MTTNMGTLDRAARGVIGVVLLWLAASETIGPWGYIGIIPLATAAIGCPLYTFLRINTCGVPRS